ncbi:MAG: xanthine dehydrogenase family protein molybdopterin-binding subunit [Verrucomicrobia bacterium]|nr:xanthine dehydrogenase family protein molybdopterin-binding subunit [Verrucomicrobiota bacterium]
MAVVEKEDFRVVGKSIPRLDAGGKVRGLTEYADDVDIPDCWHGAIVRSPVAHGRLLGLTFDSSFDWNLVAVVTSEDIPGKNIVDMMGQDMPFLAHDEIQYRGEPVALIAARTKALAKKSLAHVKVDVEEHPATLTMQDVVARFEKDPASLHLQWKQDIRKGNVTDALASADMVVEGEYWCGHQEQMYIEPQGMIAIPEKDGSIFILGSMQCPYYINPELCVTLDLPPEKIRVKQTAVGGAFGGKEDFPTLLGGYCALLAMKCGHPVKIIYDRHQDILYSTKRHPAWTRHVTGLNRDGTIAAMKIDFLLDGGAYTTLSPVVLFRGILHAAMGYECENVTINGRVFRTNTFPNGAFRGFGAPQSLWALESHVDVLAERCGMTPHDFRLKNCLRKGGVTPTGQVLKESVGSPAVLETALDKAGFAEKLTRCSAGDPSQDRWYGIGLSFFAHGAGFTGDGEARIKAKVALDLDYFEDGAPGINVRASSTEMGQGTMTILPQTAAEGLSISIDRVRYPYPDTQVVPDSGPTVASRTAMVVGATVYGAGEKMKAQLEKFASEALFDGQTVKLSDGRFESSSAGNSRAFEEVASLYLKQNGPLRVYNQFDLPPTIKWNQETFEGDAYPSYSWGCNIAEVEIDVLTLEIHVTKVTACYDIGRVLNPLLAKGQLEGGLVQCLGYAIMEKIQIQDGIPDANRMQTYVIPTMLDTPEFDLCFVEYPYDHAWPGAKGLGEIPMDGLAPAIANAIKRAAGVRITDIPITPEKLFEALKESGSIRGTEAS